ncbi:hypothetical protein ACLMJK_007721 [Lecanora helva]
MSEPSKPSEQFAMTHIKGLPYASYGQPQSGTSNVQAQGQMIPSSTSSSQTPTALDKIKDRVAKERATVAGGTVASSSKGPQNTSGSHLAAPPQSPKAPTASNSTTHPLQGEGLPANQRSAPIPLQHHWRQQQAPPVFGGPAGFGGVTARPPQTPYLPAPGSSAETKASESS